MFFQYGYFKPLAARKIGKAYTMRQLVPPAFVATILLLALGAMVSSFIVVIFAIVLLVYIIALLIASLNTGFRHGFAVAIWLPVVFFIMHFSYGLGSLKGILDFLIRNKRPLDAALTR